MIILASFVHGLTYFDLDGIEIKVQPYERVQSVTSANFVCNFQFVHDCVIFFRVQMELFLQLAHPQELLIFLMD